MPARGGECGRGGASRSTDRSRRCCGPPGARPRRRKRGRGERSDPESARGWPIPAAPAWAICLRSGSGLDYELGFHSALAVALPIGGRGERSDPESARGWPIPAAPAWAICLRSGSGLDYELGFHSALAVALHERKLFVAVQRIGSGGLRRESQGGGLAARDIRAEIEAGGRFLEREVMRRDLVVVDEREFDRTAGDDLDSFGLEAVIAEMDRDLLGVGVRGARRERNRNQQHPGENGRKFIATRPAF